MSDQSGVASITVYADYVCPFCYLGRQALSRYRERRESPLAIDWHPFDLRAGVRDSNGSIDGRADGKSDAYYERARENVRRLQARYDVELAQELATDIDSYDAQLTSFGIRERHPGRWETFDAAVYEALWLEGRDIGDRRVLVDLADAAEVSEPEALVAKTLADDELADRLEERFRAARQTGVTGVPTFVVDGHAARGAVPPEHLARLVEGA